MAEIIDREQLQAKLAELMPRAKEIIASQDGNGDDWNLQRTYVFDDQNRVVLESATGSSKISPSIIRWIPAAGGRGAVVELDNFLSWGDKATFLQHCKIGIDDLSASITMDIGEESVQMNYDDPLFIAVDLLEKVLDAAVLEQIGSDL